MTKPPSRPGPKPGSTTAFQAGRATVGLPPSAAGRPALSAGPAAWQQADLARALQAGAAHYAAGRLDQAGAAAQQVLRVAPKHPDALHLLGLVAHGKGDFAIAETFISAAASLLPPHPDLLTNLANVQRDQGKADEAMANYAAALQLKPDAVQALINRGALLKGSRRPDEALADFIRAMEIAPANPAPYLRAAELATETGRFREGVEYCMRALAHIPSPPPALYVLLAGLHERLTELDTALDFAERALAKTPGDVAAVRLWARIRRRRSPKDKAMLAEIRTALEALRDIDPALESGVENDLATICDLLGETDEAFLHYTRQNAASARIGRKMGIDKNSYLVQVEDLISAFTPDWVASWKPRSPQTPDDGHRGVPVFLVGFPRSGTTLLDQILDANPDVQVFEELPTLIALRDELALSPAGFPAALAEIDDGERQALRALYWSKLEADGADLVGKHVVNKLPLNIIHTGLIHAVFPEAKIILALRHPADSILSCFMQDFALNASMANSLTLEDAAHLYDRVMTLWRQYRELLPLNVVEVRYENLIRDIRAEVEPVLDFIGLPWNEAQADPAAHALARGTIRTPSYSQVTQPIYSSSADRWRRYEKHLAPVLPVLEKHIAYFGYSL